VVFAAGMPHPRHQDVRANSASPQQHRIHRYAEHKDGGEGQRAETAQEHDQRVLLFSNLVRRASKAGTSMNN
jgi:hypothetical protein